MSSALMMRSETPFTRFVLLCTCWFKLLVILARLIKVLSRLVMRVRMFVSVLAIIWLALVRVMFAVASVWRSWVCRLVGSAHSPREPLGSRRFAVMTWILVMVGMAAERTLS